jgi:hypothetical protein
MRKLAISSVEQRMTKRGNGVNAICVEDEKKRKRDKSNTECHCVVVETFLSTVQGSGDERKRQ